MSSVSISMVGDFMPGGILSSTINKYEKETLKDVQKFLKADITFCNFECPLATEETPPNKDKVLIHAKPESVRLLKRGDFDVVSLANNHIMDFGYTSVLKTIKILEKNNIKYTGVGKNIEEACKPAMLERIGLKVAFLAYTTWIPSRRQQGAVPATEDKPGVAPFDLNLIRKKIKEVRKQSDFLIVSVHWGDSETYYPPPEIINYGHKLIDMGANIVVGHHSHQLQGYEKYKNGLIMYDLGNFLFSPYFGTTKYGRRCLNHERKGELREWNQHNRESVILKCNISKNRILNYKLFPVFQKKKEPILVDPGEETKVEILKKMDLLSKKYQKDYYNIIYVNKRIEKRMKKRLDQLKRLTKEEGLSFVFKKALNKLEEKLGRNL